MYHSCHRTSDPNILIPHDAEMSTLETLSLRNQPLIHDSEDLSILEQWVEIGNPKPWSSCLELSNLRCKDIDGDVNGDGDCIEQGVRTVNGSDICEAGGSVTRENGIEKEYGNSLEDEDCAFDGTTAVCSIRSDGRQQYDEHEIMGSDTISTIVEDKPVSNADEEYGIDAESETINAPMKQALGDVAFSNVLSPELPPSITEQVRIIATQKVPSDADAREQERLRGMPDEYRERRIKIFYEYLAGRGPWFGVTKRMSQENILTRDCAQEDMIL